MSLGLGLVDVVRVGECYVSLARGRARAGLLGLRLLRRRSLPRLRLPVLLAEEARHVRHKLAVHLRLVLAPLDGLHPQP
eukprot:4512930-Pyramimonas_sp.AAC.1